MKLNTLVIISLLYAHLLSSQDVGAPTLVSQFRSETANIGRCEMKIEYHSPQVNGRKIFGGIIPYDFVIDGVEYPWRAGSNQRTVIEFTHDVWIEDNLVPAGSYGFVVLVSRNTWTAILSKGKTWGSFYYTPENDVLRLSLPVETVPFQEWLSYDFIEPKNESVKIALRWERSQINFEVRTDPIANLLANLDTVQVLNPDQWKNKAKWTLQKDPERVEEAMGYLEKSLDGLSLVEDEVYRNIYEFNTRMMMADLLIALGDKDGNKLKEEWIAKATGFNMYYYALNKYLVEGQKQEAFELLKRSIERDPENYPNHLAMGEYYLKEGNQEKAVEHFKKAYDLNVEQKSRGTNYARYMYLSNLLILDRM